jgi:hypothetical protein
MEPVTKCAKFFISCEFLNLGGRTSGRSHLCFRLEAGRPREFRVVAVAIGGQRYFSRGDRVCHSVDRFGLVRLHADVTRTMAGLHR